MKVKNYKICLILAEESLESLIKKYQKYKNLSDFLELRIDYLKKIDFSNLERLKKLTLNEKNIIITCRKKEEGGRFNESEEKRLSIINFLLKLDFPYVDIEASSYKNDLKPKKSKSKIILSYHNFKETPPEWYLRKIVWSIKDDNPYVIKIATLVKEDYDRIKLFRLMVNKRFEEKRVIIGMGEKGKITRFLGPILGNFYTYAVLDDEKNIAPGQVKLSEIKKFISLLT
jgi:3-dehydroquinate dehydratase type I